MPPMPYPCLPHDSNKPKKTKHTLFLHYDHSFMLNANDVLNKLIKMSHFRYMVFGLVYILFLVPRHAGLFA